MATKAENSAYFTIARDAVDEPARSPVGFNRVTVHGYLWLGRRSLFGPLWRTSHAAVGPYVPPTSCRHDGQAGRLRYGALAVRWVLIIHTLPFAAAQCRQPNSNFKLLAPNSSVKGYATGEAGNAEPVKTYQNVRIEDV